MDIIKSLKGSPDEYVQTGFIHLGDIEEDGEIINLFASKEGYYFLVPDELEESIDISDVIIDMSEKEIIELDQDDSIQWVSYGMKKVFIKNIIQNEKVLEDSSLNTILFQKAYLLTAIIILFLIMFTILFLYGFFFSLGVTGILSGIMMYYYNTLWAKTYKKKFTQLYPQYVKIILEQTAQNTKNSKIILFAGTVFIILGIIFKILDWQ